jgi:hypothetical protein
VAPAAPPAGTLTQIPPTAGSQTRAPSGTAIVAPPGTSPVPGTVLVPTQPPAPVPNITTPDAPPQPPVVTPPAATDPTTTAGLGAAQVIISPPGTTFRVGGGPYTVPISVTNVLRLSTVTLTLTYDPALLRVRTVQEGSFMRSGGVAVSFAQQVNGGRIDITLARAADATGASGTGLLAAVLFDAVAAGSVTLSLSGSATGPGSTPMSLQFRPVTVTVQQ